MKNKTYRGAVLAAIVAGRMVSNAAPSVGIVEGNFQRTPLPTQVSDFGPCQQVVQMPIEVKNLITGEVTTESSSYTLLQDGLNYWDANSRSYLPSQDLIEVKGDAAIATHGQAKIVFNASSSAQVVVDYLSPGGQRLQSHFQGLYYFEEATG